VKLCWQGDPDYTDPVGTFDEALEDMRREGYDWMYVQSNESGDWVDVAVNFTGHDSLPRIA
jgi:hypothetical protein